ncbi:HD domain-containing phosphohydrolase [Lichenihabitans sp. Uapishka_5]|uniref:HD-GYP domain-containing protein n=1 Tax=Lichenihabitans sp. Uapishka_5 TaxID=3037302 RepID=UPI0029E81179|nr:HD domain-containing phosphohydrolase [Lichenihabitans sp. Uapishka_5]MDX7952473.1 HD domain-containing phosphohydrolase [Lichenihabitans sp. Uapishka_5]
MDGITRTNDRRRPASLRLSELLGALSHALDLTEGQPAGHCLRATWIGLSIGRALNLPEFQLRDLYFTVMLKDLGCSSNAARLCQLYLADDIALKRDFKTVSDSLPKVLGFVLSHTGLRSGLAERFRAVMTIVRNGEALVDDLIETRCQRGADIASRLRFPPAVCQAIHALDEHWNGKGRPDRLVGSAIPLYVRIALLSQIIDVFHQQGGRDAALAEVRARSGTWFDPSLAACFEGVARDPAFWHTLASDQLDDTLFDLEPAQGVVTISEDYLDDIARAFAQVIDSKSPFTSGHSERVAVYTDMVAAEMGYAPDHRRWLRRAALLHDIGKLGVSNAILDKNGPLDATEWQAMRGHAGFSETILGRVPAFADLARIGGGHHERLDGTGYPRGLKGDAIAPETRIVAVADVFDALTADRPYRGAMPVPDAFDILRRDSVTALDPACVAALERTVLAMEGDLTRAA